MRGNHYRNSLRTPWLVRIVFVCVTLAAIFAAFVILRNRQIKQGDQIRQFEVAIGDVRKQIEEKETKIAGLMDRNEIEIRCSFNNSTLVPIKASQILVIEPMEEVPALPKVASSD